MIFKYKFLKKVWYLFLLVYVISLNSIKPTYAILVYKLNLLIFFNGQEMIIYKISFMINK